jgi:hypothetical protein
MTSDARVSIVAVAICCTLSLACADFSRGPVSMSADAGAASDGQGGDGEGEGDAAALSFTTSVHPLLLAACKSCHATGQQAGDTMLLLTGDAPGDYLVVSRFVDTAAPAGARLLSKMSGNGHGGGSVYAAGSPEYQTVLRWIQQGARP